MDILTEIELTKTTAALAFLLYASFSDYKSREVTNSVWAIMAPFGFALTFLEIYINGFFQQELLFFGACFALTSAFALVVFFAGGFGGADAKAFISLALILPFYPTNLLVPLTKEISPISANFFPLSVFNNSVLLAAFMAIVMLIYNIAWRLKTGVKLFGDAYANGSLGKRIVVMITGYKTSVDTMKQKWHIYPLEDIENTEKDSGRKLLLIPKDEGRDDVVKRLDEAAKAGKIQNNVWATPGLPFLIFVTAGLIVALFMGDLVWNTIRLLPLNF